LPYYPIWAVLIIAFDLFVIWAVTAHGRDITMVNDR
jgi:TRAP-type mannitol/chloroaromatic compound transport system permease small subunit